MVLGRIVGVHGVRGWIKLESHTRPREAIFDYSPWRLGQGKQDQDWQPVNVLAGQARGNGLVAQLEGIDDRDVARSLMGALIAVPREQLPEPAEGEVYWTDLEGCTVINRDGVTLGQVDHLMETGANDVMVVRSETGDREYLIPYIDEIVDSVDLETNTVRVDWDEEF